MNRAESKVGFLVGLALCAAGCPVMGLVMLAVSLVASGLDD